MNKKQYNNIINHSLQYDCKDSENPLDTARIIFNNMGVALPQGTIKEVYDTISTGEYMGWKKCTLEEAKEAANNGIAAMGISENKIVVLSAEDDEQPVSQTNSVLTLTDNTPAVAVANLQYYSYSYGSTTGGSTTIPTIQRSIFGSIEYNGYIYDIFVPNHMESSINPIWYTVDTQIKHTGNFDFWKFIAGLSFPNQEGGITASNGDFRNNLNNSVICRPEMKNKIGIFSLFAGALNSASDSYNEIFLKFTFQKTSDNKRRVIIEAGSTDAERTFNNLNSDIPISAYYNNAGSTLVQVGIELAVGNLYEEITGNPKDLLAIYDCEITIDSRHKNDCGAVSYLWIDMYGILRETPIIYPKDKVSFGIQHGIFGSGEFESFYNPVLLGSFEAKNEYQQLFNNFII